MGNGVQILSTILPIIIILAVGMLFRAKNMVSREGIDALKKVVISVTLPALLIGAFATMEYSVKNILLTIIMYGMSILAVFVGKIFRLIFREQSRFLPYITTGFEAGMIGYALVLLLYGQENISNFASIDLGQTLFIFTLYKALIGMEISGERPSGKKIAKDMLTSPVIVAIIVGIVIGATGLYNAMIPSGAASVLNSCTDFISAPTAVIILIAIGYDLVPSHIPWKSVIKAIVSRVIVMIGFRLLAGLLVRAIGMGDSLDPALNILCICPPGYVLPIFADSEENRSYISSTTSIYTVCTMIFFVILTIVEA